MLPGDRGHLPAHGGGHGGVHSTGGRHSRGLREVRALTPLHAHDHLATLLQPHNCCAATQPLLATCCSMSHNAQVQCAGIRFLAQPRDGSMTLKATAG
jgi:hypothetical protein